MSDVADGSVDVGNGSVDVIDGSVDVANPLVLVDPAELASFSP